MLEGKTPVWQQTTNIPPSGNTAHVQGFVRYSGRWVDIGFHFSFVKSSISFALSMHLLGCRRLPAVSSLICVHLLHLHFLDKVLHPDAFSEFVAQRFGLRVLPHLIAGSSSLTSFGGGGGGDRLQPRPALSGDHDHFPQV